MQSTEHLSVKRLDLRLDRQQRPARDRAGRLWKFNVSKVDEWMRGGADEHKDQN